MPSLDGVDVSGWQGGIDWPAVPKFEVICAKATQGSRFTDSTFAANWAAMRARGTPVRVAYHFVDQSDPVAQADHAFQVIGPLRNGELVMVDVEPSGTKVPILGAAHVRAVINNLEARFHKPVLVYIGRYYPNGLEILGNNPWWLPAWTSNFETVRPKIAGWPAPVMWQWGGAPVAGITPGRNVDANQIMDRDRLFKLASSATPPPAPAHQTIRLGSRGEDVALCQRLLNEKKGYGLKVDGIFGPKTDTAVRNFQRDIQSFLKLSPAMFPVDGIVGPKTWYWLTL